MEYKNDRPFMPVKAASRIALPAVVLASVLLSQSASAGIIYDRGLPSDNLNNAAGSSRSNVGWDFAGAGWFAGDDFTLGGSGNYLVDSIKFWLYPDAGGAAAGNNNDDIGDDGSWTWGDTYASLGFYLGSADGEIPLFQSGNFVSTGSNSTDNTNISITRMTYPGVSGQPDYQGTSGSFIQLYEVELSNLNLVLAGGTTYQFGAECIGRNDGQGGYTLCFNHATNAALAGTTQEGSDDLYRYFYAPNLDSMTSAYGPYDSNGSGWDKSSDVNIQIFGAVATVPEPATLGLALLGLAGIGLGRRRKARKTS